MSDDTQGGGASERVDDYTVCLNLLVPGITLIAGMADYPALIVHSSYSPQIGLKDSPIGTGTFVQETYEVATRATYSCRKEGWWGGEVNLDGVEFIDYGTDPSAIVSGFEAGEIHVNDETTSEFVEIPDALDIVRKEKGTANTIVARMRAVSPPF